MASTWSALKFELIGTGDQTGTWGATTNANIGDAIEQAIGGKADVTMSSTSETLTLTDTTSLQNARALYLNLSGTPGGAATLNVPAVEKAYIVYNGTTGGYAVTVKVSGQTGVSVPNGKTMVLYDNGTDVVDAITHLSSLTLGAALPVASGGTGATTSTGSGAVVLASSPTLTTPNLGTPSAATLTNATGLPISTGVSGLGSGVATFLATPSSTNLRSAVTDETGSGSLVFATSPTLVTPALGTPSSGTLTSCTGLPLSTGVTGTLPLANGGTGAALIDPNADRILFWDDSAGSTAFLTAGSGLSISGTTLSATGSGGTVTSVAGTGTVNGISLSGAVTSSGSLTLGGALTGVNLASQVTGTLPIANGGTGSTSTTYCNLASNVSGTLPTANGGTGNANGTVAKLATTNFSIEESGGNLVFKYGATTIGSLDSSGNFTVIGNVVSNGSL